MVTRCVPVVREEGDGARATCTCGWSGPLRTAGDEREAERDLCRHTLEGAA